MIPPIIEKMDTASLDITYGSRAQIRATTHMTPLAVVEDNSVDDKGDGNTNPKKHGFQHV
jgi:hypothetical protein